MKIVFDVLNKNILVNDFNRLGIVIIILVIVIVIVIIIAIIAVVIVDMVGVGHCFRMAGASSYCYKTLCSLPLLSSM